MKLVKRLLSCSCFKHMKLKGFIFDVKVWQSRWKYGSLLGVNLFIDIFGSCYY